MRDSYEQARKDHEYLWSIGPADNMTGGYVDQEDLVRLLESPTKATAMACYIRQIDYWFQAGPDHTHGPAPSSQDFINTDSRVREIAIRRGHAEGDDEDE